MKLVAGLGNPGSRYRATRHNVGFEVMDLLAARHELRFDAARADAVQAKWGAGDDAVLFVKPLTFMNLSGEAVSSLSRYYKVALPDVLVVCDDVYLPLGRLRLRATGSEGGHNGLRSIALAFGTMDYPRLRIGVGRGEDTRRDLADHVLARFDEEERPGVERAVARAADAVETWISHGIGQAMNLFNRSEPEANEA